MQRDEQYSLHLPFQTQEVVHPPSVARILARLGLSEGTEPPDLTTEQVIAALRDPRWERRASAATAWGKKGKHISITPLLIALSDDIEEVRAAAARALGRIQNAAAVSALTTALQDSQSAVREASATALGRIGEPGPTGPLSIALLDEAEEVRAAAAQALGRVGGVAIVPLLVEALQDPQALVREAAAEALGELGNPTARLPLLAHIQDEEDLVRDAIAHALLLLEQPTSREIMHILFREEEQSVQQMARSAVSVLMDLGLHVHEEEAPIAPLVVALQSADKEIEKTAMCYVIGRALDTLNENIPLKPLLDVLHQNWQQPAVEEGIWKTIYSLAQRVLQEWKTLRLLVAAANDPDVTVRAEIDQAVKWLVELALALEEERGLTEGLQIVLEDKNHRERGVLLLRLVKQALEALEERESVGYFLTELGEPDVAKRAEVGKRLARQARKALLRRLPEGALIISLKDASDSTPLELQFGNDQEQERNVKEGRHVFPWAGPSRLRLPSLPDSPRSASLGFTLAGNICFK